MTTRLAISIAEDDNARIEIFTESLLQDIQSIDESALEHDLITVSGEQVPRVGGLDIVVALFSSAAVVQLAAAVRDWVQRQNVAVHIRDTDGRECTIKMQGNKVVGMTDLAKMIQIQITDINIPSQK